MKPPFSSIDLTFRLVVERARKTTRSTILEDRNTKNVHVSMTVLFCIMLRIHMLLVAAPSCFWLMAAGVDLTHCLIHSAIVLLHCFPISFVRRSRCMFVLHGI
ncbi:unnamed protein product [Amoebophrya sp. A25]|nr:unnamed protein product [Amoebophrya sp. A25]|eukprot:GSA25T00009998001.1